MTASVCRSSLFTVWIADRFCRRIEGNEVPLDVVVIVVEAVSGKQESKVLALHLELR